MPQGRKVQGTRDVVSVTGGVALSCTQLWHPQGLNIAYSCTAGTVHNTYSYSITPNHWPQNLITRIILWYEPTTGF